MLTKCLALEWLALELKFSPMVLRGLGALQSWSPKISSPDLSGYNLIGAAQGVRSDELAGFPHLFLRMLCKYRTLCVDACMQVACKGVRTYMSK